MFQADLCLTPTVDGDAAVLMADEESAMANGVNGLPLRVGKDAASELHDVSRSLTSLLCVVVQTTTSVKAYRNGGPGDGVHAGDSRGIQLIPGQIF
jgi:hypothetical protein